MRIGINGSFWEMPATGSGQYLGQLLPALAQCSTLDDYVLVVPQSETTGRDLRILDEVSPRTFLYPEPVATGRFSANFAKVWFEQRVFGHICRRERIDLAHVPYFAAPYFSPVPTVVTIHDLIPMILPRYRGSPLVRLYTAMVAASARRAQAVIADSECSKQDIVQRLKIPAERVHVVLLAAHPRFRPVRDAGLLQAARNKYALPDEYLLYLGGYDQRKNVSVLIEAMARLAGPSSAGYHLVLAGALPSRDSAFFPDPRRLVAKFELQDRVHLVGPVAEQDQPAVYSGASVVLFPSIYEGFGLPPLEAMACGIPVISSNASSLPEVAGAAAALVDPNDVDAWAATMHSVLSEPSRREEMSARGLDQASRFSWTLAAQETLRVYRSTVPGAG